MTWRVRGDQGSDEAIAACYCYVDASNFERVKAQLQLYAAVEVRP